MNADGDRDDDLPHLPEEPWVTPAPSARVERRQQPAPPGAERRDLLADRYELLELLGRGSSASVWHAYDKRLAREVALKIFHLGNEDREDLGRALREAKAASHIVSDHVVRIRDVAWGGARGAYIDMELCADFVDGELVVGRSMAHTPARNLREAVRWVMEAAQGVQTAHELRVFHRDLKPDNILIRPASRSALVTDFGLARQPLWREEDDDTPLPGADLGRTWQEVQHYVGTPPYMAPEQAEGLFRHLARLPRDPATAADPAALADENRLARIDVYGLGAILYEALAGHPPYQPREATSDRTQEAMDVLSQVRTGAPPALRGQTRVLRSRGEGRRFRVPRRLERIVRKAMARQPRDRYATPTALARDLQRFLDNQPTSFERRRYHERAVLWSARNWRPLLASTLAVTGFVGLFTLWPEDSAAVASSPPPAQQAPSPPAAHTGLGDATLTSTYGQQAHPPVASEPSGPSKPRAAGHDTRRARRTASQPEPRSASRSRSAARTATGGPATVAATIPTAPAVVDRDADRTATPGQPAAAEGAGTTIAVAAADRAPDDAAIARGYAAAFVENARRGSTPLIQVLDASGSITEYCLSSASGRGTSSCIPLSSCSVEQRERLERIHRQSTRAWIWHLDSQRRVIRKCEKSRPYDNSIIRKTCDPVVVG